MLKVSFNDVPKVFKGTFAMAIMSDPEEPQHFHHVWWNQEP